MQGRAAGAPSHGCTDALDEYIDEERGHDEWILNDIRACGGDAQAVSRGRPGHATEVMVAFAYDAIARGNPLGFFGMVHVLEGTSVSLALLAAEPSSGRSACPTRPSATYARTARSIRSTRPTSRA